jgi:peptidoglycan L-alanyl-D-glutamate endopeptidase CwlK
MASRDISLLLPDMQAKTVELEKQFEQRSHCSLLIYCTERPLREQAVLYRQSRSWSTIKQKMTKFKARGLAPLADILEQVGPQNGPHVTNAAPGESWHGFGESFDCVPMYAGKCLWSYEANKNQWDLMGSIAADLDLHWAGNWKSFREYPHVQYRIGSNPLKAYDADFVLNLLSDRGVL